MHATLELERKFICNDFEFQFSRRAHFEGHNDVQIFAIQLEVQQVLSIEKFQNHNSISQKTCLYHFFLRKQKDIYRNNISKTPRWVESAVIEK
jgi:hypothetical protein